MKITFLYHKSGRFLLIHIIIIMLPLQAWAAGNGEEENGSNSTKQTETEPFEATVTYLEGYVRIDKNAASLGQTVAPGARIRTGADSYCDVTFANKNIFRIEPNTLTTISIVPGKSSIDIERGSIDAIFDRLKSVAGNTEITVTTPSMVAGVRGTVFYIKVEDPKSTYVCTCYGTVHQHGADQSEEDGSDVTAYHHAAKRYILTDEGSKVESAGLLYHDDEAMNAVADRIGVTIPWGKEKAYE
jgi:hypothetical protein